jgi:hypothetical protein
LLEEHTPWLEVELASAQPCPERLLELEAQMLEPGLPVEGTVAAAAAVRNMLLGHRAIPGKLVARARVLEVADADLRRRHHCSRRCTRPFLLDVVVSPRALLATCALELLLES